MATKSTRIPLSWRNMAGSSRPPHQESVVDAMARYRGLTYEISHTPCEPFSYRASCMDLTAQVVRWSVDGLRSLASAKKYTEEHVTPQQG